uniref:DNA repair protein XRCC1 n=1 Tax=Varanus komodoensis TaxID=61221 RepID=A0A8D2J2D3_VARKO
MPEIAIRHVVSASNSDTTHCAENLLKADTYRKWKAAQPGEKQVSVILQFEKEEQIYSIDIGNEGSAFVEVLAGSSASSSEQSYEVLLVTSSFMSPSESKGGTNLNRVRMFGPDKLVKATAERKWDRVKIVCTQPYTKSLAYGLSFVRFHSPPENNEVHSKTASPKVTKLGLFKVKEEDSNSSSLKPGALFFSRVHKPLVSPSKASQNDQPSPSYAAASLQTSMSGSPDPSPSSVEKPTSKGMTCFPLSSLKELLLYFPPLFIVSLSASPPQKMTVPKTSSSEVAANGSFQHLLDGTVFVLSGFQNPFRSELRHKALEMGGKYRPDWTPDSTHLICAFANTPKYSQVKGLGGIIVRKEWILDCYRTRRHLPCKRKPVLLSPPHSPSTVFVLFLTSQRGNPPSSNHKPKTPASPKIARMPPRKASSEEEPSTSRNSGDRVISPGFRVEEEHRKKKQGGQATVPPPEDDPYGGSTDENTDVEEKEEADQPIPELPDLFGGKHFFLYGEFPSQERRLLNRYITAFSGEVEAYMNERVNFVVTAQQWDDTFEEALNENANLSFVRPRWIYNCNERQKLIPHQPYVVVPQV